MPRLALLLAVLSSCAAPRLSAGPSRALRIEALRGLAGLWLAQARNPSTGVVLQLRYQLTPTLDGAWLQGTGEVQGLQLYVRDYWGRDGTTGELVRVYLDSHGTWGWLRSKGWEGDTLRFEGVANASTEVSAVRETIRRVSADELQAIWESKDGGEWRPYSVEQLVRQ